MLRNLWSPLVPAKYPAPPTTPTVTHHHGTSLQDEGRKKVKKKGEKRKRPDLGTGTLCFWSLGSLGCSSGNSWWRKTFILRLVTLSVWRTSLRPHQIFRSRKKINVDLNWRKIMWEREIYHPNKWWIFMSLLLIRLADHIYFAPLIITKKINVWIWIILVCGFNYCCMSRVGKNLYNFMYIFGRKNVESLLN